MKTQRNEYMDKTLLNRMLREHCEERLEFTSQRMRGFVVRLGLLVTSETIPINSHQHDCLNRSWERPTTTGMSKWMRKAQKASILHKAVQTTEES